MQPDRRLRRSSRLSEALQYQLEAARDAANLRAVVVADEDGLEVAGVGDASECTELAAYAPIAARGLAPAHARDRLARREVAVRVIGSETTLYVCASGGEAGRADALRRAGEGTRRILGLG